MTAPLAWLIDTHVISEMMRPRPEPRVAAYLDSISDEGLGLASVTVREVFDGIGRLDPGRRQRGLTDRFKDLLDDLFEDRIIGWSLANAQACAQIMEEKRRRGEALDDHVPDAFLAAAAVTRGLAVITRNTSELRNTGVETVDPWAVEHRFRLGDVVERSMSSRQGAYRTGVCDSPPPDWPESACQCRVNLRQARTSFCAHLRDDTLGGTGISIDWPAMLVTIEPSVTHGLTMACARAEFAAPEAFVEWLIRQNGRLRECRRLRWAFEKQMGNAEAEP